MITSAGLVQPKGQAGAATFAATLTKPVKQSDLLDTIVTTFAAPPPTTAPRARRPRRASRAKIREAHSLRVLVAEDNATNQKLVLALLRQRGHRVVVVGNGRQAVETSAARPFDVILMDVQMPELGGLEATAAIRARERDAGGHVPIIALTAHAMSGDREEARVIRPARAIHLGIREAGRLTGLRAKTDVIHAGLRALITRESARRLAALGGKLPKAQMPSRRRSRRLR
jgi:CheY-like chemotaxis protein